MLILEADYNTETNKDDEKITTGEFNESMKKNH